jgi:DNA-directed RNA polymerase subunit beta
MAPTEIEIEAELARAWLIDAAWESSARSLDLAQKMKAYDPKSIQDDDEVRRMYLEIWLGDRGYDVYR